MIKYTFICFHKQFDCDKNLFSYLFLELPQTLVYSKNIEECDLVIIGSFIDENHLDLIKTTNAKKILYVSEPILSATKNKTKQPYKFAREAYDNCKFDFICGSIYENNTDKHKHPIYFSRISEKDNYDIINKTNSYVKSTNFYTKKFCALVNSHDRGNTRTDIFNKINTIDKIDCPGKLFNNCSNEQINSIGKVNWLRDYLFNICPENRVCIENSGYITEKLMQACLSGTIPIYYGSKLDEIDIKIFNTNRIIFFDPNNTETIDQAYSLISTLMTDKEKLKEFYSQDVFLNTAIEELNKMKQNVKKAFENVILDIQNSKL